MIQEQFMQRCLELARQAEGLTYPNPMVGAVIVHNNRIIGEGFHRKAGDKHAEIIAIESVADKKLLKESTLYVNLEPCAHQGKTPPCVLRIIEEKIPNVVIGSRDSNKKVSGKGVEMLRSAKINAVTGILEDDCRELNRRFFTFHEKERPYIILKWAETEDGFIDAERKAEEFGRPTWITDDAARRLTHLWRSREQAILVGSVTAIKDNPMLTVRHLSGKNPVRLVLDREGKLSEKLSIFNEDADTLVFTNIIKPNKKNAEYIKLIENQHPVKTIISTLYQRNICSLIVEGGAKMINLFLEENIWDEARVFVGNKRFGNGVKAPQINKKATYYYC